MTEEHVTKDAQQHRRSTMVWSIGAEPKGHGLMANHSPYAQGLERPYVEEYHVLLTQRSREN